MDKTNISFVKSKDAAAIDEFIRERGITRLVHFTNLLNLLGILQMKAVLAHNKVRALCHEPQTPISFYDQRQGKQVTLSSTISRYSVNDDKRLDGRRDCICCSIEQINDWLLSKMRERRPECAYWCRLDIDPAYMQKEGVIFTVGNAASKVVKKHGTRRGIAGLRGMFADEVHLGHWNWMGFYEEYVDTRFGRDYNCPTCPQAEVLVPDQIPIEFVRSISFDSERGAEIFLACQEKCEIPIFVNSLVA